MCSKGSADPLLWVPVSVLDGGLWRSYKGSASEIVYVAACDGTCVCVIIGVFSTLALATASVMVLVAVVTIL